MRIVDGRINTPLILDSAITLPKLPDGVLTADVAGRAKMVGGFINAPLVLARNITTATIADAAVTQAQQKTRAVVALADAAATLIATQMIDSSIFTITPTAARTLTTDTAANIVAGLPAWQVGTWFDITIICLAAHAVTLAGGIGVTITGSAVVNNVAGSWRARIDSTTAVTIYRLA